MSTVLGTSIRHKVTVLVLATTASALMLAAASFLAYEVNGFRKTSVQELQILGEILAYNAAPFVSFESPKGGTELLESLKAHGHITRAQIHKPAGGILSSFPEGPPDIDSLPPNLFMNQVRFLKGRLQLTVVITTPEGKVSGALFLEADQSELYTRMKWAGLFLVGLLIVVGLLVWITVRLWVKAITGPVLELTQLASKVSDSRDYSLRAQARKDDELGILVESFNGMLERIQEQDRRLADHRGQLESEVANRTADLVSANNELVVAKEHAEVSNRAKSSFLANMSHELRTPLNAILLYSELVVEEAQGSGMTDILSDVRRIETAGRHLLNLINDILDLSKIEAGKMTVNLGTFEVPPLIREVLATVGPLALQNGNTLNLEVDPAVDTLESDATKVRQSLFNLLSNACKFTKDGQITVRTYLAAPPGLSDPWLHIAVEDTGIGISPEQQLRIFSEFIQAEENTNRLFGGTGLGLALSRRFCQVLGGDIRLHSEPGKGSVFTIVLPLKASDAEPEAPAPGVLAEEPSSPSPGPILIMDDDPFLLEALSRLLMQDGHQVVTALDGADGLRLANEVRPGLIVLDVMMPRMDGWEVLKSLKANPALAQIPVVMLTILDEAEKGLALGAVDYLFKPIDRAQLTAALRKYKPATSIPKVLVVEDDIPTQQALQRILLSEGWESWPAMNGFAALDHLRKETAGLILLDLMMPGMDGFSFLAEKQQNPTWMRIPVIVLTARDLSDRDREKLRQAQVSAVLQKGHYSKGELIEEVRRAIHRGLNDGPGGGR